METLVMHGVGRRRKEKRAGKQREHNSRTYSLTKTSTPCHGRTGIWLPFDNITSVFILSDNSLCLRRQERNYLRRVSTPSSGLLLTMLKDADLRTDLPT